jgi:hypothetical protein
MFLDLENSTLPALNQELQARACFGTSNITQCCSGGPGNAVIKNCGQFLVYNLRPPSYCTLAYCATPK